MVAQAPISHLNEAQKLEADASIDLWSVHMRGISTIFRFWNGPTMTWQGDEYNGLACQLHGEATNADGSNNRPTLVVNNPEKIFGVFAAAGYFDLAEVIRKRVLQQHVLMDVNEFQQRVWLIGRPAAVLPQTIQLELRAPTDMPAWKTPRRHYSPPEFPYVTL